MSQVQIAQGAFSLVADSPSEEHLTGFAPRALLLWWSCQDGDGCALGNRGGIGFVGGAAAGAICWVSENGVALSQTASRAEEAAFAGMSDTTSARILRGEAELTCRGFTMHCSGPEEAWRVHYMAIGGEGVQAAVGWSQAPAHAGLQRLHTGLAADLVLLGSVAAARRNCGQRGLSITLGAATGPRAQAATGFASLNASSPGSVGGAQVTDAVIPALNSECKNGALARLHSLPSEEVVLDWVRPSRDARQVLCLAVSGLAARVKLGAAPGRPRKRRFSGGNIDPHGFLCFTWGLQAGSDPVAIGRLSCGGTARAGGVGTTCWDDRNTTGELTATHVHSSTEMVLLVSNTRTGGIHAAAAVSEFGRGGWTLDWRWSDDPQRQVVFVVLGRALRSRLRRALYAMAGLWLR